MHDESWGHEGGHREHGRDGRAEFRRRRGERGERGEREGRGGRRGGWGGPGPFGPMGPMGGGFGGPFGPDLAAGLRGARFGGRGPRVRRGDVRAAILDLMAEGEQAWNGYQFIQTIADRTDGLWRPSAGSVYPALQQLEDEGLIETATGQDDRRRMYTLTDTGRQYVADHAAEIRASWDAVTGSVDDAEYQLRDTIRQVIVAAAQVQQAGSAAQVQQANKILADTRRALYRILAADGDETVEDSQA
jgi:DNA-binding PadR family transcriptional regulator